MDRFCADVVFEHGVFVPLHTQNLPLHFVSFQKLHPVWVRSYKITWHIGEEYYWLKLPSNLHHLHNVFSISQLKQYIGFNIPMP